MDCRLNASKVAVTELAAFKVTLQAPVPEQAPLQARKREPVLGEAVSCTTVPPAKLALQVRPQVIPDGELVTVPLPVPANVTVKATPALEKVAVTELAALTVTVQVAVPEQAPDHPAKAEPTAGVADNCTTVPTAKSAVHPDPQLIPAGVLDTVPEPFPARETVRGKV